MRAAVVNAFGSFDAITIADIPPPVPGAGDVLIDVQAAGVNFADMLVVEGKYQSLPEPPFVPGKEIAGVVAAVGDGASRFTPGDRVMAYMEQGGFAELALAVEDDCYILPSAMPFKHGASMGINYQTAHFALNERGRLRGGESVLINGASGCVGMASIQLAKAAGATVLAGIRNAEKASLVLDGGADHVVDLAADGLRQAIREQVYELTGGRGADVILDTVGGDVFDASLRALAWSGRIVVIGFVSGRIPTIPGNYLLIKNITASGFYWDSYRTRDPQWVRRVQDEIFTLYGTGKIKPPVSQLVPLENVKEAFSALAGRRAKGRLVLTMDQ